MRLEPGQLVADRYQLVRLLGQGGQAWVYQAHDLAESKDVALRYLVCISARALWEHQQELSLVQGLRHPNLIRYLASGEHGRGHFVVMPLLGESVAQRYSQPVHDAAEACRRMRTLLPLLDGLEFMHQQSIVHGDIKAANVLFARTDDHLDQAMPVLCDFAAAHPYGLPRRTPARGYFSPSHLSPERLTGAPHSPASDLYSLGCLYYEVLTGAPPFTAEHLPALVLQHAEAPPPSLARVPEALASVLYRLLAKAPQQRYASGAQLRRALHQALYQSDV